MMGIEPPVIPEGHVPVMTQEVLDVFAPHSGNRLLDATVGLGGHAAAYLNATAPDGMVVGLDADAAALATAQQRLDRYGDRVVLVHANFGRLKDSVIGGGIVQSKEQTGIPPQFTHILFDLGIGSHQLGDAERGFSFKNDAPLSMRYGAQEGLPPSQLQPINYLEQRLGHLPNAQDIVDRLKSDELALVLSTFGEERLSKRISAAIKRRQPKTAQQLASVVTDAVPASYEQGRIHPATRTFQALRLAVNRELEVLTATLPDAVDLLEPGGVLAVISFHSLEDRIVKQFFRETSRKGRGELLTKRPLSAQPPEVQRNPRARSAKLRAIRKKE